MPGSSSWMPCAPHGVKGLDDDYDDDETTLLWKLQICFWNISATLES